MRKLIATALIGLSSPAFAQLYGTGTPAAPRSTPYASVSQDSCAEIFSHANYTSEVAWIGGYLSAVSIINPNSFTTEGGMPGIFRSVEKECSRLPSDTPLIDVIQKLVPAIAPATE